MTNRSFLLDVNVLIALSWPHHVHHGRAQDWFGSLTGGWATTPITESGFLRLSMNERVVGTSVSMADSLGMLAAIRGTAGHQFIADGSSLASSTIDLGGLVTSRQVTDAHLVDLAAAAGAVLATLDRGIPQMLADADREHVLVIP
ncbi:MAG: TA system VapC family ribonuclease toxin [Actinomycetota bacterium]